MIFGGSQKTLYNLIILLILFIILALFYNVYKAKLQREDITFTYNQIKDFLSQPEKHSKPILWIYLEYEKNARNWESFYSRTSMDLNQGYLNLTTNTIIQHCQKSFHICLIDDNIYKKLLPDLPEMRKTKTLSGTNLAYMRLFGICNLLYEYGGLLVPSSFLCLKDLTDLTKFDTMAVGEFRNQSISNTTSSFAPSTELMYCKRHCPVMKEFIIFLKKESRFAYTSESDFVGKTSIWWNLFIKQNQVHLIEGHLIGTKDVNNEPILLEDLISNNYLAFNIKKSFGIYLPHKEILSRTKYSWFARLSPKQVLESNTRIGKLLLVTTGDKAFHNYFEIF